MTHILSDPNSRPAGWNGYLNLPDRPNAAKTGTANKRISATKILPGDTWTIGYTPQITAAAWLGNNDGSPMGVLASGLATASPIWSGFMRYAHTDLPVENFEIPEGVVQRSVSRLTGKIPSETTPVDQIIVETFAKWAVPLEIDDGFTTLTVDAASGRLPSEFTPESALEEKTFVNLHSQRPTDANWEQPVREWLAKHANDEGLKFEFTLPPTEIDNIHTAETAAQKPTLSILSPVSGSTVSTGDLGVWVDVTAAHGIQKVEYFRDGELVATATTAPWKGTVVVPSRSDTGERFTITAKVYDRLYYSDTSSVEVIVGTDTQAPTVRITAPTDNQAIARGTTILAKADAFDSGGDIAKVRFELDGGLLAELTSPPFEVPLVIRSSTALGTHRLRVIATDTSDSSIQENVYFEVVQGSGNTADFSIISPPDGAIIPTGTTRTDIIAQLDRAKVTPAKIEFIARNRETGDRQVFAELTDPAGETFTVTWSGFTPGNYELYLKVFDSAGKALTSGRTAVEVR
jgi:hypothetical protein